MPRSPAPERVNRALQIRIDALKDENADLEKNITRIDSEKEEMADRLAKELKILRAMKSENEQMKKDLTSVMAEVSAMKGEMATLKARVEKNEKSEKKSKG
jgi:predicted  nucleic acid-binding Zn-ribbon protein